MFPSLNITSGRKTPPSSSGRKTPTSLSGRFSSNFTSKKKVSFEGNKTPPKKVSNLFLGRRSSIAVTEIGLSRDINDNVVDTQLDKSYDYQGNCVLLDVNSESISFEGSKGISKPHDDSLFCVETTRILEPGDSDQSIVEDLDDTRILMMSIISSPISLGYFLSFCEAEFNSEYLKFFIAVEKFRSTVGEDPGNYLLLDEKKKKFQWDSSDVSGDISNVGPSDEVLKFLEINQRWKSEIFQIWSEFLDDKDGRLGEVSNGFLPSLCRHSEPNIEHLSPYFIALPQVIYTNIQQRMYRFDKYGGNVFKEAVIAMLTILHRDIFPRFLLTGTYIRNREKGRIITDSDHVFFPSINTLVVKPPGSKIIEELSRNIMYPEGKLYTLDEVLADRLLYSIFLSELKKSDCDGLLLCYQMILIFKEFFKKKVPPTPPEVIEDQIWNIYLHFVAVGSSCEICIPSILRESIKLSFGSPSKDMFTELEAKVMVDLTAKFETYKNSYAYQLMADRALHTARKILQIEAGPTGTLKSLHNCSRSESEQKEENYNPILA